MDKLKWPVVAVVSAVAGYFGHQLTGSVLGVAVCMATAGLVTIRIIHGDIVFASMVLVAGVFVLFQVMTSSVTAPQKITSKALDSQAGASLFESMAKGEPATADKGVPVPASSAASKAAEAIDATSADGHAAQAIQAGDMFRDCAQCPEMVALPAGVFTMGSKPGATGSVADGREGPQRAVTLLSLAVGQDAITRGQFAEFVEATRYQTDGERNGGCFAMVGEQWEIRPQASWKKPGFVQTDRHPAVCVSWNDAQAYSDWLRTITGHRYRLLTEAEREYAARAGSEDSYWWGEAITMDDANFRAASSNETGKTPWRKATTPVQQFSPNPFGLYNVHGNVWEWVQDCQHDNYNGAPSDGSAWMKGCVSTLRGMRGGSWASPASKLRSAERAWVAPDMPTQTGGFRVARDLKKVR